MGKKLLSKAVICGSLLFNVVGGLGLAAYVQNAGGLEYFSKRLGITEKTPKTQRPAYANQVEVMSNIPVHEGEIIFLGDSLTGAYPWAEALTGVPVRNFGIGGDNTLDVLARLDSVTTRQPSAVFLMIGTNDHAHTPEQIADNVREIILRIERESPRTAVVLKGLLPESEREKPGNNSHINTELQRVAEETGAIWLDFHDRLLDESGHEIADRFTTDGIHLTDAAYRIWVDEVEPLVKRMHRVQRRIAVGDSYRPIEG